MRKAKLGTTHVVTEEMKQRISKAQKGKTLTDEHRRKLSVA